MSNKICPKCGGKKSRAGKVCHRCKTIQTLELQESRTLESISLGEHSSKRWSHLRKLGHKRMLIESTEKVCFLCDFDEAVELHHIKAIHLFSLDALVSEVNAPENLVYLCPNHHVLVEKGKVKL